jgi:TolB-like protein/DNA-binding winged helix-turn-helix (wHTH) protein
LKHKDIDVLVPRQPSLSKAGNARLGGQELAVMASNSNPRARMVRFATFEADLSAGELRKGGVKIKVHGQPFEVLAMLLEQPGEIVPREELKQKLWPTDTFVDFDHGVNTAIKRLREALGDSAENPRFVETIPRRGYRFIAPVEPPAVAPAVKPDATAASPSATNGAVADRVSHVATKPTKMVLFTMAVVVAVATVLGLAIYRQRLFARRSGPPIQSIAVLPLTNLSSDADQDYFADGMTDVLITNLGKIGSLRVISRTSVMQYKSTKKPLPEIARDLNVDAIIEGTVSRSGNHLRITANLVQVSPERHLWAETYDSEVGDALTVQGELAQAVARKIQVTLTQKQHTLLSNHRPANPDAQDLYFRGADAAQQSTEEAEKTAIRYLQQAIEKDPSYAEAYSGLAMVYALWMPGDNRPQERMPKAREFAVKALSLDNDVRGGHLALGAVALLYDWDWTTAENELQRELESNPNDVFAHALRARALVARGKTEEAVAVAKRLLRLSPAVADWDNAVWVFILARRYDLAREYAQEEVDALPNFPWGYFNRAQIYEHEGRVEDVAREFLRADELLGTDPKELERLRRAMAEQGERGYWRRKLQNYRESARSGYVPPVLTAMACVRTGDKQCAFEWLEKGFQERDDLMINLKVEPVFDGLQEDQRFQALVRRVGIPEGKP